jgi:hypothetical protein
VDGYNVTYTSVNNNITLQGGIALVDASASEVLGTATFSGDIGMQSFGIGTLYVGADLLLPDDGDLENSLTIGYSKRKIDELGYDFSISRINGESTYAALIRIPLTNSGGVLIGISANDLLSEYTIGYSIGF